MANITEEIKNFSSAIYGKDVRGAMVSLAEKLNTEVENNTVEAKKAAEDANKAAEDAYKATEDANAAEEKRAAAEVTRVEAEEERIAAEATRVEAEEERIAAEAERVEAEEERIAAEAARGEAETERVAAEEARGAKTAEVIGQFEETLASMDEKVTLAKSYAKGGTGTRDGEDTDNSMYYADQSKAHAEEAAGSAEEARAVIDAYDGKKVPNGFVYEDNLLYLTSDGVIVGDPIEILQGSGSGSGTTTVVKLTAEGDTVISALYGTEPGCAFNFTSTDDGVATGDGTGEIMVNDVKRATFTVTQGYNYIDIAEYLSAGRNIVRIKVTDVYGAFKLLYLTYNMVDLRVTSIFDDSVYYTDVIPFKYTLFGEVEKTAHVVLDGKEVHAETTTLTNRQTTVNLTPETHGVHTLDVYVTTTLNEEEIESDHLTYEIMYVVDGASDILIASVYNVSDVEQGTQVSIPYSVYNPSSLNTDVELVVSCGEEIYSTQTVNVDRTRQTWNIRNYPLGGVTFTIKAGEVSKSHTLTVTESAIKVESVTNDMELFLSSAGRSNNELTPDTWAYNDIATTFTDVNWSTTGWVQDDDGDSVLRLSGGAKAEIAFKPFETDWKTYGKTIEIEFTPRDVNNRNAVIISCMDGGIGFEFTADTATLKTQQSEIGCKYNYDKKVKVTFVIESKSEYRLMQVYMNGVCSQAKLYPTSDIFQQSNPVNITIGSEYCGVDIYSIRSYTNALTKNEIVENYIADIRDIGEKTEVYEKNAIYNKYGVIQYSEVKTRNHVMTIIGDLPQSKGDKKNVTVKFEHMSESGLSYEMPFKLDVQGTSSQWYVRKNFKGVTEVYFQVAEDQVPVLVFCIKADYAEATGTHNTQSANLIETLYSEKIPPQEEDPRVRTAIFGYPIVVFHQETETSTPVFVGKYNYNLDKGSLEAFGFTPDYDVECWEFCDNTSDPCNFLGEVTADNWADSFEARYPEGYTDITRFKVMHDWVVSTTNDLEKFKNEFENYFNLHYTLIYYVFTTVFLAADQRAKNLFLTYWASKGKWYPYWYDGDTIIGINNEGKLVFDYYHEDTDTLDGANVYNGQNSVLWVNFRQAFAEKIKECYQELRNDGKLTYDIILDYFVNNGSEKWSESIYNEDGDYKYISMLRSDGDSSNLYQVRGDGKGHLEYFMSNRLNYLDSKWYASDYANNYITLRIYTPSEWAGVEPNADITISPFSAMYAGVRYGANGTLVQERLMANEEHTFTAPDETFNDTETAVYGASEISYLKNLAPLYCGTVNLSKAKRLVIAEIGSATEGYSNPNLTEVSFGTNRLLKKVDIQNCPNLTEPLDLTGCPNIEEVYAFGSGLTGVDLPNSGYLKVLQLPETIINLTLKNQLYITDFQMAGYDALLTLDIENCPAIDVFDIMDKAANLERLRLAKVNWSYDDATAMLALAAKGYKGVDDYGDPIDTMNVSGKCHINALTGEEYASIKAAFPYLEITYNALTSYLICMAGDQVTELHRQAVINGADGYSPLATGEISTPTMTSTAQYTFAYAGGWTTDPNQIAGGSIDPNAFRKVEGDRYIYPVFNVTVRCYDIEFYNGSTLLYTDEDVPYGSIPTYVGDTPESSEGTASDYPFLGWAESTTGTALGELLAVTGTKSYYAVFGNPYELKEIEDDWATIVASVEDGSYLTKYSVGNYKPLNLGDQGTINMQIVAKDTDPLADGSGNAALSWIGMELLATSKRMNPSLVENYIYPEVASWSASGNTWTSQNRYVVSDAVATWTITATDDQTLTISYKTSNGTASRNTIDITVNGEAVATDHTSTTATTYTVDMKAGDTVTVSATYSLMSASYSYYGTVTFSSTGTFTTEAQIENAPTRQVDSYAESTGAIGGWGQSELRTYLKDSIKPLIEDDVRNAIKEVTKTQTAYDTAGKSFTQTSADDVWIPDYYEVCANPYTYKLCYPDNESRKKCKFGSTSATYWWLRRANSTSGFWCISTGGSSSDNGASNTYGVALGFCL